MYTVCNSGSRPGDMGSIKKEVLRAESEGSGISGVLAQPGRELLAKDITFSQKKVIVIKPSEDRKRNSGSPHKEKNELTIR